MQAHLQGSLTTSPNALPLVMDLLGKPSDPHHEGFMDMPHFTGDMTIDLTGDHSSSIVEGLYHIAQDYPDTIGAFTITTTDGSQSYRIEKGKMHRRTLSEAPEREVSLYTPRTGPIRALLVTCVELEGIKSLQRSERNSREARQRRA